MAKEKQKYKTEKALSKAIDSYFNAISCKRAVPNAFLANGKPYFETVYLEPPTVNGLCLYLGINRRTWERYSDKDEHPEFYEVTSRTKMRMEAYLENILVTREKGSLQGVIFNLQNNYGWREKKEVELGKETRDAVTDMSLSDKLALIADLKSGKLDIPADIPDEEDDEEE